MVVFLGNAGMQTRSFLCPAGTTQRKDQTNRGGGEGASLPSLGRQTKRKGCRRWTDEDVAGWGKRSRAAPPLSENGVSPAVSRADFFERLPDDIVVSILCFVGAAASAPSELVSVMMTCKRMKRLLTSPMVLSKASARSLAVRAKNWSPAAHFFLKMCADAGNLEACYILGMIRFYCLPDSRSSGAALMAKAAIGSHAAALYSLSIIQFNGSGGSKNDKNLRAGVALCARAAYLGHVDALRELGHCLQDGYGVQQSVQEGRRFLLQANYVELASVHAGGGVAALAPTPPCSPQARAVPPGGVCPLLSDYGCYVPAPEPDTASKFLIEWFADGARLGMRLCSHAGCGRPETRPHEFRRCSVCGAVNYCSRACQAIDWKLRHRGCCTPQDRWRLPDGGAAAA